MLCVLRLILSTCHSGQLVPTFSRLVLAEGKWFFPKYVMLQCMETGISGPLSMNPLWTHKPCLFWFQENQFILFRLNPGKVCVGQILIGQCHRILFSVHAVRELYTKSRVNPSSQCGAFPQNESWIPFAQIYWENRKYRPASGWQILEAHQQAVKALLAILNLHGQAADAKYSFFTLLVWQCLQSNLAESVSFRVQFLLLWIL